MKRNRIAGLAAALLVLAGLVSIGLSLRKNVVLVVDGERQKLTSFGLTVEHVLASQDIQLEPEDRLQPAPETPLTDGQVIWLERAVPVLVRADGRLRAIVSAERMAGNLLMRAGVRLYPGDRLALNNRPIEPDELLEPEAGTLEVIRSHPVVVHIAGMDAFTYYAAAPTLEDALEEAGIVLHPADRIEPPLETPIDGPIDVLIIPSRAIIVHLDDKVLDLRSAAPTVGKALVEAGFALQGLDYSIPAEAEPLPEDGHIRVVRVQEQILVEQVPLPFEVISQPAPDVPLDEQRILQTGAYGLLAQRVRVRLEDGEEVSRVAEDSWIAQEPTPRIVGYGTKIERKTLAVPGGTIEYWRAVTMYATSYSPCRLGVPNYCNDVTASGLKLQKGVAAVTRSLYNVIGGQQVFVPDYGVATIADIGGGLPGRAWIDLGYSDQDYVRWARNVTVYFLWPPPPLEQIIFLLP
jgi:resuscitation-promoting factor RpfB